VRRTFYIVFVAALALAVAAPALGARGKQRQRHLWATINICDTLRHPDELGVRASMPGNGRDERMYMRFHAQYWDATKKLYLDVPGTGRTSWIYAGSARYRFRQAGFNFGFDPPKPGQTYRLRGLVEFQWRAKRRTKSGKRHWVVVRRAQRITRSGHEKVPGADPPEFSASFCVMR
jgi:hypothetical protein